MGPKIVRKDKTAVKAAQVEAQKRQQEEKEEEERREQERLEQLERERKAKRKKEETEMIEKSVRDELLQNTCDFFSQMIDTNFKHLLKMREGQEWERYVTCDRLPFPNHVPSMNTYLYTWQMAELSHNMEDTLEKNEAMLSLLNVLEDYISEPLDAPKSKVTNWKEVRENYRKELYKKLNLACFHKIRDIENRFKKINYWESDYEKNSSNIYLWMWVWMVKRIMPAALITAPAKTFGPVSVKLPKHFGNSLRLLRILHLNYDHFSDQCHSWEEPKNPVEHDIYDETTMWHDIKVDIITDNYDSLFQTEEVPCWFQVMEEEEEETCSEEGSSEELENHQTDNENDELEDTKISRTLSRNAKKKLLESMTGYKEKLKNKIIKNILKMKENKERSAQRRNKYVGTLPIPDSTEIYKITSDGEVDIVRTDRELEMDSDDDDWDTGERFEDWVSLNDSMETEDDMDVFEILYHGGMPPPNVNSEGVRFKTLPEMLREVEPRTGRLGTLNLPEEVKKGLLETFGIKVTTEKKKVEEYEYEVETPFKSLAKHLEEAQLRYNEAYKNELKMEVNEYELNLRKSVILGGVYHIDLIEQVPQPHQHQDGTVVQINYGEYNISKEDYYFKYVPPLVTEEEDNDEEDGKAPVDDDIDKLISVDIQVSDMVLWFETPSPYLWDEDRKVWSSENIYDSRFNEEKQLLSFRIGKTSPIGVASFKFYNLPYQTWEIRPAVDWKESNSIIFSLTASTVIVEYTIQGDNVSLNSIQNATGAALDGILGIPYRPNQLIRIMRQAGLDLFPGWDSYLYIEGNSAKKKVLEEHIYMCMALLAPSYQYTWSRWNMAAGHDRIIFQMREYLKPKDQGSYKMVLNTTHRSVLVNCTEVSPSFSDGTAKDIGFQPDLYNLLQSTSSERAKKRAKKANTDVLFTLYYMLQQTKIFSFS